MWLIDQLAESRITEAIKRVDFNNLTGAGRRVELDDDRWVPESLRAGYRVIKNAGLLPPELSLRRDIAALQLRVMELVDGPERARAEKRLRWLSLRLAAARGSDLDLRTEQAYQQQLWHRLGSR